ncbi:MAG: SurA N-terminal domain-containing protein [Lysobacterales bacterium]
MMQAIRDRASGFIAWAIIGTICVVLVATGSFEYFNTTPQDAVASVNGEEIPLGEFTASFSQYRARMQQQFGGALGATYFDQPLIRRQHLEQMISRELRIQAAEGAGLAISPQRIRDSIQAIPAFNVGNSFDQDQYLALLSQQGLTPRQFESDLADDLLVNEISAVLQSSAFALPSEVSGAQRLQAQLRSFEYVSFDAADYRDQAQVSDEDIQTHYDNNPADYTNPEQVVIEYVLLTSDTMAQDIEVSESTLLQRYEAQKARFVIPERRMTSHILIETGDNPDAATLKDAEEKAATAVARIRAGEAFADVAAEMSDDLGSASTGGDLGWVEREDMVEAFEETLFSMAPGDVSDPVNTAFGFHVIWLREIEESRGKSFDEARDELAADYRETEVERLYIEQQDRLYDLSYEDAGSLQTAADALALEVQTTEPVSRTGGAGGIAANPDVIQAAFADQVLLEGSNSDPINLSDTETLVLRVSDRIDAALRPLDEVVDEVRDTLTTQKARELAEQAAQALVDAAKASGSLADALASSADDSQADDMAVDEAVEPAPDSADADDNAGDVELADSVTPELKVALDIPRFGRPGEVDGQLAQGVFRLAQPDDGLAVLQVVPAGPDSFSAVSLQGVTDGEEDESGIEAVSSRIVRAITTEEITASDAQLRDGASIDVIEDRLTPIGTGF